MILDEHSGAGNQWDKAILKKPCLSCHKLMPLSCLSYTNYFCVRQSVFLAAVSVLICIFESFYVCVRGRSPILQSSLGFSNKDCKDLNAL